MGRLGCDHQSIIAHAGTALNISLARRHDLTHAPLNRSFSHAYSRIGLAKLELGESDAAFESVLKAQRLSRRESRASLCHLYLGIASVSSASCAVCGAGWDPAHAGCLSPDEACGLRVRELIHFVSVSKRRPPWPRSTMFTCTCLRACHRFKLVNEDMDTLSIAAPTFRIPPGTRR